jgi:hypothetical protein
MPRRLQDFRVVQSPHEAAVEGTDGAARRRFTPMTFKEFVDLMHAQPPGASGDDIAALFEAKYPELSKQDQQVAAVAAVELIVVREKVIPTGFFDRAIETCSSDTHSKAMIIELALRQSDMSESRAKLYDLTSALVGDAKLTGKADEFMTTLRLKSIQLYLSASESPGSPATEELMDEIAQGAALIGFNIDPLHRSLSLARRRFRKAWSYRLLRKISSHGKK